MGYDYRCVSNVKMQRTLMSDRCVFPVLACIFICSILPTGAVIRRRDPYDIDDYKNHSCIRTCKEGEPTMTCRYYFLVEHYTAMSAACYGCPSRRSHCSLPQCVTGNGLFRPLLAVNRMVPGPALHVCKGDTIEVLVDNRMELGEGTTIHWHGIKQRGTPYMDGMSMITQCPITKWSKMTYRFTAADAGSYFWHSHAALQRSDGLFGSLIIRQPATLDPHAHLYDVDLPEHAIMLNDWAKTMSVDSIVDLFYRGGSMPHPSGILVNGRGQTEGGPDIPFEEFTVRPGLRYRFRVIYSGILNCPIYVRIDGHDLLMIASDGNDFEPVQVNSFTIYSGERYDFVLNAKEAEDAQNGTFWMRFKGLNACQSSKTIQAAILRYDNFSTDNPSGNVTYSNTVRADDELTLNDRSGFSSENNIQIVDLKSLDSGDDDPDLIDEPDRRFYIALAKSTTPDERFMAPPNPDCSQDSTTPGVNSNTVDDSTKMINGTLEKAPDFLVEDKCNPTKRYNLQLNYITGRLPPAPPLTQYGDVPWKLLCNGDNIERDCTKEHCECVHTLAYPLGDLVELVLVSPRQAEGNSADKQLIHPMHIHGHWAKVVTMLRLSENNISVESVKAMDERGEISRLRSRAPRKDTTPVGDRSVVILRFRADNPGFWFFHCHIEVHTELGMALVLQEGQVPQMPQPPQPLPKCDTWSPDDSGDKVIGQVHNSPVLEGKDDMKGRTKSQKTTSVLEDLNSKREDKDMLDIHGVASDSDGGVMVKSESETGPWIDIETQGPRDPQETASGNKTDTTFVDGESLMIIAVAAAICLALPATIVAALVWFKRRRQKKSKSPQYRLLVSSAVDDAGNYESLNARRVHARPASGHWARVSPETRFM